MGLCGNCKYYDSHETKGYKGYCTTYGVYVDPDDVESGCTRFEDTEDGITCYLTSACVKAKGLSDDCRELTILRKFRDGYLKNQPSGEEDIKHYYRIAPKIVKKINEKENAIQVWEQIYVELISVCVELLEKEKNDEAYAVYRNYSLKLEEYYL